MALRVSQQHNIEPRGEGKPRAIRDEAAHVNL
jgi:hypothetical protein